MKSYDTFAYCNNNPVNMTDAGGHWPDWNTLIQGAFVAVIGIAAIAAVVGTGGAATPLVALGLSTVATAGVFCVVWGHPILQNHLQDETI